MHVSLAKKICSMRVCELYNKVACCSSQVELYYMYVC